MENKPVKYEKNFQDFDSPCVAVCSTLFDDVCRGCGRTVEEVANWVSLNNEKKKEIWNRIILQGYPKK